jgi:hypothetical protein
MERDQKAVKLEPIHIGCCGAFCGTCPALRDGACRGCKLGYGPGERDIDRAKCRIKLCCFRDRGFQTCVDCPDFASCGIIRGWLEKKAWKYRKYRESLEFIRDFGYAAFLAEAETWKGPYGRLPAVSGGRD